MTKRETRRFAVREVSGYHISTDCYYTGRVVGVSYVVLDSAVCYRLMREWPSPRRGPRGAERRLQAALAYADELEAECAEAEA